MKENNKLIAKFDEHDFYTYDGPNFMVNLPSKYVDFEDEGNQLYYDSEWNWIMPVVEKIEKKMGVRVAIIGKTVSIEKGGRLFEEHDSKRDNLYDFVVYAVKKYNKGDY